MSFSSSWEDYDRVKSVPEVIKELIENLDMDGCGDYHIRERSLWKICQSIPWPHLQNQGTVNFDLVAKAEK